MSKKSDAGRAAGGASGSAAVIGWGKGLTTAVAESSAMEAGRMPRGSEWIGWPWRWK
mgnify:CR=1 FL=1